MPKKKNDFSFTQEAVIVIMKNFSFKQALQLFLVATAVFMMLAQPLSAAESSAGKQEESFFQALKRKTHEWLDWDNNADKAKKEVQKQTEKKPEKQSDGRKAIDKFKKRMKKASDNVSRSVDKDKKTVGKKLDKLFGKK